MGKKYYEHICPCGNKIEIKAHHKKSGVPKVCKSGHIGFLREVKFNTRLVEGRRIYEPEKFYFCICGCGKNITIKKQHKYTGVPRYMNGHNPIEISEKAKKKLSEMKKGIPRTEEEKKHIAEGTKLGMLRSGASEKISEKGKGKRHPHTEETKKKLSETRLKNNPWKGQKHSKEWCVAQSRRTLGKNNPMYGKKHSDIVKRNQSELIMELILKNGGHPSRNQYKRGSFYSNKNQKEIRYESSYELQAYQILEKKEDIKSYDRCKFSIEYIFKDELHRYIPDIRIIYVDDREEIIEIKPEYLLEDEINQVKFKTAKEYCSKNSLSFSVWTEKELRMNE